MHGPFRFYFLALISAHLVASLPSGSTAKTGWKPSSVSPFSPSSMAALMSAWASALSDGCSRLGALFRIFLPVTTPGMIAVGIFSFISSWGEFFFALLFTSTISSKPVTVVASDFAQEIQIDFTIIAAGGVLVVLLPIILAFIFQRFIIHGIGGAVTG